MKIITIKKNYLYLVSSTSTPRYIKIYQCYDIRAACINCAYHQICSTAINGLYMYFTETKIYANNKI